jgi:hypothetical protein
LEIFNEIRSFSTHTIDLIPSGKRQKFCVRDRKNVVKHSPGNYRYCFLIGKVDDHERADESTTSRVSSTASQA